MSSPTGEFIAASLAGNSGFLKMTLADMSDAELMLRPVPGANHPNWQLGHLIVAETNIMSKCGAPMPELPAGFADRYKKETCASDDASKFATKADLLALFDKTRAASVAYAKTLSAEKLAEKGPLPFTPTIGDGVEMQAVHLAMHLGQIQVLRRKLGKPILF